MCLWRGTIIFCLNVTISCPGSGLSIKACSLDFSSVGRAAVKSDSSIIIYEMKGLPAMVVF